MKDYDQGTNSNSLLKENKWIWR